MSRPAPHSHPHLALRLGLGSAALLFLGGSAALAWRSLALPGEPAQELAAPDPQDALLDDAERLGLEEGQHEQALALLERYWRLGGERTARVTALRTQILLDRDADLNRDDYQQPPDMGAFLAPASAGSEVDSDHLRFLLRENGVDLSAIEAATGGRVIIGLDSQLQRMVVEGLAAKEKCKKRKEREGRGEGR